MVVTAAPPAGVKSNVMTRHDLFPKDDVTQTRSRREREEPGLTEAEAEQRGGMKPD